MKVQPFVIKSIPAGDAYWVVVPTQDMDAVQLGLDIGGGEGPVVAIAEWIHSRTMPEGGFLYWTVNGDAFTSPPRWLPHGIEVAIEEMARGCWLSAHQKQSEA